MKPKVSNFYLCLNWLSYGDMTDYNDTLESWLDLDQEQAMFAAGLPASAKEYIEEARASTEETIKFLAKDYRDWFLKDASRDIRKKKEFDLKLEREKLIMIDAFISKSRKLAATWR
jgi:hypothetical protein